MVPVKNIFYQKGNALFIVPLVIAIFLFIFIRSVGLSHSLLFFGDLGRDFLVMQDWYRSHKPPLLGPQTSALPINQSAWYFYFLMPVYILSGQSFYTHTFTLFLVTISLIAWYAYLVFPFTRLRLSLLLSFVLLVFHPETIVQQRYIWNPSFIPILLLGAILILARSYYQPLRTRLIYAFTVLLALAIGLSYAVFPVVLFLMLTAHMRNHKGGRLFLWLSFIGNLLLVMLPTLVFELRHQFLLTNRLLFGEKLSFPDPLIAKITRLPTLLFSEPRGILLILILVIVFIALLRSNLKKDLLFKHFTLISAFSLVTTLLLPFPLNSHYIFAFLTLLFFWITLLPIRYAAVIVTILVVYWLRPAQLVKYTQPAPRTVAQTIACVRQFCRQYPDNYYVTTQSAYHPQHDAKDYEYLFNQSGCQATDITLPKFSTSKMAVIVEDSVYEHKKTAYNELTLFGAAKEVNVYSCLPNLSIYILEKSSL